MNYKDPQNNLHDIEPDFAHLLPEGCIAITQEEADAIIASKVVPPTYAEKRAQAYPPIADQLDAFFHAGIFPAEMAAKLAEVKARFPK